MPWGIDLNPFDDDEKKPSKPKTVTVKKKLPKTQRGLYPPGPGYVHTDEGWVKAKTPADKKKASTSGGPKYVATAYEDREYTPSEAKGKYRDEAKLKREAAAAAKAKRQEDKINRRIAHLQAMEFGVTSSLLPGELNVFKPDKLINLDKPRKPGTAWDGSPVVKNRDGTTSSVRSMSFDENGREVLVPTVWDGKIHSDDAAIKRYEKTGEHFGKYDNVKDATAAANLIHVQEMQRGVMGFSTIGTAPLTWKQQQKAEQEDRNKRRKLVQGALMPGSPEREEYIRRLSPSQRAALAKMRRPTQPAAKPWEPNLGPMTSRIPGAREGMQIGHWAEGLIGHKGVVTREVMAAPGQAWWLRNRASDVGNAGVNATVAAVMAALDPKEFTPSQLKKDVENIARIAEEHVLPHVGPGNIQDTYQATNWLADRIPKVLGQYGEAEGDPGNKQYIPGYGWLWGKGTRGQQIAEAAWAIEMGFNKSAEALLINSQKVLSNTTPEQRAAIDKETKEILQHGRGAEIGRDWVMGPAISAAMEGGPMTNMAYVELAMLLAPGIGFTPARPVIAGTRAGIKGVRMLPKGGRHAWGQAVKEFNRIKPIPGLETSERGSISVGMLGGIKQEPAWRAGVGQGFRGQQAKSALGRRIEELVIDPTRAKLGMTLKHGGKEAAKSARIQRTIAEAPYKRLEKAAAKMGVEDTYVIRALASGVMPLDRQLFHLREAEQAPDVMGMYSHMVHADLNEGVAKYVFEDVDGTVQLREDAPKQLHQIWEYYKGAYEKTEDIWRTMDVLSTEAIEGRVQATGKIMKGGKYVDAEAWAVLQLQHSESRAELVHEAFKLVDEGLASPEQLSLWMDVIDAQARALAMRKTNRLRRQATYYRKRIRASEDESVVEEYMARLEEVNNELAAGVDPSSYYEDLLWVKTGPARNLWPELFGADHQRVSFFAALKHWSDEVVDKRLASKLDEKKFHNGLATNPTIKRKGYTVAGKVTPKAWLQRVKALMPTQEEQAYWAEWYEDYAGAFAVFGEDAEAIMRGFAASQANQAPAGGITSVLKVMDKLRKGETVTSKGIGMVAKAVEQAVKGSELEKGVAAKLSDFADALRGADVRTWMGDKPQGGAPAPADIWAARDLGYVDKKHAKRLVKVFGLKEGVDFIVDSPGAPSGLRYERIAEQYTEIAEHLNDISFHGRKDWKPAQVQALGWASAQKMVGIEPEDLAFALQRNTRSVDFELTKGPLHLGGDLDPKQAYAVARAMVPEIRRIIEDTAGVYFRDMSFGVSGWSDGQNGSIHVDILGSERDIQNLLSRFARAFDQEYVQASREISKDTARASLTIGSEAFADETVKVAFFKRLHELSPEIPVLNEKGARVKGDNGKTLKEKELSGYMPDDFRMADGSALPGIAIRTTKRSVSPATAAKFTGRFATAIEQVEQEMGIKVYYSAKNVELLIGSQYGRASALSRAGNTGGIAELDDSLEAAARKRLTETVDAVRRGERPEPTDHVNYLAAGRASELGIPHAEGHDLDEIIEHMGANNRPHLLNKGNAAAGKPPRIVDVHDPKDVPAWSQGHETISLGSGARAVVPGSERPPEYLYRAISEEDWTKIKDQRFIKSDERMNLGPEGTVTSLDDPSFYLPGKLASDKPGIYEGRIVRIKYDDADGWLLGTDGYVKTQKAIPLDRVDMVSPLLVGERGTRLSASGREMLQLPVFRPVPYETGYRQRFMALGPHNESLDPRAAKFDGKNESHFAQMSDEDLQDYADWSARYGDELSEVDEHPDIVNEYWGQAHEANDELARRTGNKLDDYAVTLMWHGEGRKTEEFVVKVRAYSEDEAIELAQMKADPQSEVFWGEGGVDLELRGVQRDRYMAAVEPPKVEFTVIKLPDDPKLSAAATARRQARSGRKRGTKGVRSVTKPHQHHAVAVTDDVSKYYEDRRWFAPGEQARDLERTEEGDQLVHDLVDNHPELVKALWELDPQDAVATELNLDNAPSAATIERAKDMVRDLTWDHLNEKYPEGTITLYRGGRRATGEEGVIPWTTNYGTALNTFAKGDPAAVRVRTVNIGEVEASLMALSREVPGAWYKGFSGEDEMLLWGDDTARYMAATRRRGPSGTGHASSYEYITPQNPATAEALTMLRAAPRGRGFLPVAGIASTSLRTNKTKIGISERHGSAYTIGHELFHYLETQLTPQETKILKEGLGEGDEDIVMGWTTWLLMGGGGRMGPVFQKLTEGTIKDLAATGFDGSNARAIPRNVSELITALHEWDDLKGGAIRILDENGAPTSITHTTGVAKEVFHPGMPIPLRKQLWDYLMFARAQKTAVRGRGPIGALWSSGGMTKQMKGLLLKSGMFEADVIKGSLRDHFKALKLDSATRLRADLLRYLDTIEGGGRTPSDVTDYAIKVNPDKTASPELARYFDIIQGIDSGDTIASAMAKKGGRFKLGELEKVHEDAITSAIRELFPAEVNGEKMDKVAARLWNEKTVAEKAGELYRGEIENIRWVPRDLVEASHLFEPPSLQKARRSAYAPIIKGGVSIVDLGNDLFRLSLLMLNPAYYPMNLIGNLVMNMIQQGPFAVYNLPRAWRLGHSMARHHVDLIDNLGGEGWMGIATIKSNLLSGRPSATLANVANMLVDRIPRRAAWLHEAMRMGYRKPEDIAALLDRAVAGDAQAAQEVELITRHMLEEMVDFNNLSPFERDFMTRLIFVYPWLKGSTVYTLRFPLNHPVQTAAFAYLYERQQATANNEVGDRPQYLELFYPFANKERFGKEYPYGMVLRQMFTFTTTYDIFNAMYGYTRGDVGSSPLTEYLQPLYGAILTSMTGYDPFLDKKVDRGIWPFLKDIGKNYTVDSPGWQNFSKAFLQTDEERQRHAEEGRLYPRNRMDDILRFVFGSLAPGPVNPETAQRRAREGQAASPADKTLDWVTETEEITGHKVPVRYTAIQATKYRYSEIQSEIRKEEGTSDLTPWQLTEAKMRTYLEAHPEMEDRRVRWSAAIANADADVLDDWDEQFSLELGWTGPGGLSEYQTEVDKYKDAREQQEHAAAAAK